MNPRSQIVGNFGTLLEKKYTLPYLEVNYTR
jgi:hypothetical protein